MNLFTIPLTTEGQRIFLLSFKKRTDSATDKFDKTFNKSIVGAHAKQTNKRLI